MIHTEGVLCPLVSSDLSEKEYGLSGKQSSGPALSGERAKIGNDETGSRPNRAEKE